MNNFLNLKSVWEDEDIFEVRVMSSNQKFSGEADCYTTRNDMKSLASLLTGFPKNISDQVSFTTVEGDDLSYFGVTFKCVNGLGHIKARVKIVHIFERSFDERIKEVSEFEFGVEASAIDLFAKSVFKLANEKVGDVNAQLIGVE